MTAASHLGVLWWWWQLLVLAWVVDSSALHPQATVAVADLQCQTCGSLLQLEGPAHTAAAARGLPLHATAYCGGDLGAQARLVACCGTIRRRRCCWCCRRCWQPLPCPGLETLCLQSGQGLLLLGACCCLLVVCLCLQSSRCLLAALLLLACRDSCSFHESKTIENSMIGVCFDGRPTARWL